MFRFISIILVSIVILIVIGSFFAIYNPTSEAYIRRVVANNQQTTEMTATLLNEIRNGGAIQRFERELRQAAFMERLQIFSLLLAGGAVVVGCSAMWLYFRYQSKLALLDQLLREIEIAKAEYLHWYGQAAIRRSTGRIEHFYNKHPARPFTRYRGGNSSHPHSFQ